MRAFVLAVILVVGIAAGCATRQSAPDLSLPRRTLRVATAEMVCKLNDPAANLAEACRLSEEAGRKKARLVLFPEGCLTGTTIRDRKSQALLPTTPEPFAPLQKISDQYDLTISIGFATPFGEKVNMVHAILRPNQPILFQHKAAKAADEPEFLEPWPDAKRVVFTVDGVKVVMMICSEFGFEHVIREMEAEKPDLVLHSSAGHLREGEVIPARAPSARALAAAEKLMRGPPEGAAKDAARRRTPRLASNPIGFDGELYWPGNSYAVGADGKIYLWVKGTAVPSAMRASVNVVELPIPTRAANSRVSNLTY
jgi:predicted amidohydrolase